MNVAQALESALRSPRTLVEQVLHNEVLRLNKLLKIADEKIKNHVDEAARRAQEALVNAEKKVDDVLEAAIPDPAVEAPTGTSEDEIPPTPAAEAPAPAVAPEPTPAPEPEKESLPPAAPPAPEPAAPAETLTLEESAPETHS